MHWSSVTIPARCGRGETQRNSAQEPRLPRRISPISTLLVALTLSLAIPLPGFAQTWPVPNATGRVRVERVKKTAWPARVGYVQVWPGGADPAGCNVSVFTAGGRKVGSQLLWAAAGDPLKILFDTSSGEVTYDIYLHRGPASTDGWQPEAGVVFETRPWKGGAVDTFDKAWKLLKTTSPLLGRSVMTNIFLGIHPHGSTTNFMGHFSGWFDVKKPGDYEFAVMSTGPAYLRVDGKLIVNRPMLGGSRGRRGEFNGKLKLAAGRHQMDFLCVQPGAGEWMVEAAWKQPGQAYFELMSRDVFSPVAMFESFSYAPGTARASKACLEWETIEHNIADGQALLTVEFRLAGGRKDPSCSWQFDDGTTAKGSPVTNVFALGGLRTVRFQSGDGAASEETCRIEPRWSQIEEWSDAAFERQKKRVLATDHSRAPVEDLCAFVRMADTLSERQWLSHFGAICLQRQSEFKSFQADTLYLLGRHYQTPEVRNYKLAEDAWRAAIAASSPNSGLREKARLRLAQCLTDVHGRPAEALEILRSLDHKLLLSDYIRLARLFEGDALAALNKIEEATRNYQSAGNLADPTNRLHAVRGAARLESARDLIRRGEFDAAEEIIRQIEWETPLERLSAESGIMTIQIHLGRKEYPLALSRCQRLLYSANVDTRRAEVLYHLIETELALNRTDAAAETFKRLLKDHPYSEATARAKDKWVDRLGAKAGR